MQRVSDILKDLKAKAGADAALVTSSDGLVLGAAHDDGMDLESFATYAASNMLTSERMGETAQCGIPESVIIIYQGKALVMAPLGPVVAILLGSSVAQLGNLRLQMKRALVDLSAALKEELDLKAAPQAPEAEPAAPAPEAAPPLMPQAAPPRKSQAAPAPVSQPVQTATDSEPNGNRRAFNAPRRSSVNLR